MRSSFPSLIILFCAATLGFSVEPDAEDARPFVRGGIYDKPFMTSLGGRAMFGGYADAQFRFERADGFTEEITFALEN